MRNTLILFDGVRIRKGRSYFKVDIVNKKKFGAVLILILLVLGVGAAANFFGVQKVLTDKKSIGLDETGKIKSVNLSLDYLISETLQTVKELDLNAVNVPVQIDVIGVNDSSMTINRASETKAIEMVQQLESRHIKVILEPFPYIKMGEVPETEWLPADQEQWFDNWQKILDELIDKLANPDGVYAFYIGSNFEKMEQNSRWAELIEHVRQKYKGKITYRTNWWSTAAWDEGENSYQEKLNNPLFGKLDFISVAAYFELTEQNKNTVDELVDALHSSRVYGRHQNIAGELREMAKRWNKPFFFGELGFPCTEKAAFQPWNPAPSFVEDGQEQANCFAAYQRVFADDSWNMGFSVFAVGSKYGDKPYYPSAQSIEIIKRWYE